MRKKLLVCAVLFLFHSLISSEVTAQDMLRERARTFCHHDDEAAAEKREEKKACEKNRKDEFKLRKAQEVLVDYLIGQGITEEAEHQRIIVVIRREKPQLLLNLFFVQTYHVMGIPEAVRLIMDYYQENQES